MRFNYSKLLGKMRENGFTQEKLAKAIGINESTLNTKLNNKAYFTSKEICSICGILGIANDEIGNYFYTNRV